MEHSPGDQSFPRSARLIRARDFERVLRRPDLRLGSGPLRLSVVFTRMHSARLGLVVGKKAVRRATARNRIRRVVRDRFRLFRRELGSVDVVVRVVGEVHRRDLHRHLDRLLGDLAARAVGVPEQDTEAGRKTVVEESVAVGTGPEEHG